MKRDWVLIVFIVLMTATMLAILLMAIGDADFRGTGS